MKSPYNAILVGARCAGSPTAMLLARKGYRVLVVDRARFPGDTVSSHVVHPLGAAALARWGLLDRLTRPDIRRCNMATLEPPSPDRQQLFGAIHGKQKAMDGFAQVNAGTISPAEFFSPLNLGGDHGRRASDDVNLNEESLEQGTGCPRQLYC